MSSSARPRNENTVSEYKQLKAKVRAGGEGHGTITTLTPIRMVEPLPPEDFVFICVNLDTNAAFILQKEGNMTRYFKEQNGHPAYVNLRERSKRFLAEPGEKTGIFITTTAQDNNALLEQLVSTKGINLSKDSLVMLEPLRIASNTLWDPLYDPVTRSIYIKHNDELSQYDVFPPKDEARLSKYSTLKPLEERIFEEKQQAENASRVLAQFEAHLKERDFEAIKALFTGSDKEILISTESVLSGSQSCPRIFLLFEWQCFDNESIDYETDKKIYDIITYCLQNMAIKEDDTLKYCIKAYSTLANGIFEKMEAELKKNKNINAAWLDVAKCCTQKAEDLLKLISSDFKTNLKDIFGIIEKKVQKLNVTLSEIMIQLPSPPHVTPASIIAARGSVYTAPASEQADEKQTDENSLNLSTCLK